MKQKLIQKLTIISLVVLGSTGCALFTKSPDPTPVEKVVYVTNPLYAPSRPELPTWTGKDMECLAPDVKQKIRDRDTLRREYAEKLEVIIRSTQK